MLSVLAMTAMRGVHRLARRFVAVEHAVAGDAMLAGPGRVAMPDGLDRAIVLEDIRSGFMRLQAAWDARDVQAMKSLTTPEMLDELLHVLTVRGAGATTRTDVVSLHAELLALDELGPAWLASVEFSGLIRESVERDAVPFRELWMLARMKDDAPAWRLARQQSLF